MNRTSPQQLPASAESVLRPEEMVFSGRDTMVDAFTDPARVPPAAVSELIETAVANRPDADALRQSLIVRFAKALKMSDHGISAHDAFPERPGTPSDNPQTVYVTPHPRPTAGATVMPAYADAQGDIHVLLARNYKDPQQPALGLVAAWHFPGGYLEARTPDEPGGRAHDANLDAAAARELKEETGLDLQALGVTPEQLFVRSEDGAARQAPSHAIDAFYLADLGRRNQAPPVRIGDDVGQVAWVRLRDIVRASPDPLLFSGPNQTDTYQVMMNGRAQPFKPEHAELLERGAQAMRERLFPLHEAGQCACCRETRSAVQPDAHAHHDKLAMAHGYRPMTITIELGDGGWQHRLAGREAEQAPGSPSRSLH